MTTDTETDTKRAAIESVPDSRPDPLEAMMRAEDTADVSVRRWIALIRAFPKRYAHALCEIAMGNTSDESSVASIARACKISKTSAWRHIQQARRIYRRLQGKTMT